MLQPFRVIWTLKRKLWDHDACHAIIQSNTSCFKNIAYRETGSLKIVGVPRWPMESSEFLFYSNIFISRSPSLLKICREIKWWFGVKMALWYDVVEFFISMRYEQLFFLRQICFQLLLWTSTSFVFFFSYPLQVRHGRLNSMTSSKNIQQIIGHGTKLVGSFSTVIL